MSKWEVSMFRWVGSSCEDVDSNRWLPFQCKLCINIYDVILIIMKILLYVHVNTAFVLIPIVHFNFWTLPLSSLRHSLQLEIWDNGKCKGGLALSSFAHFGMKICGGAHIMSLSPSNGSHTHFTHLPCEFGWPKVLFER